MTELIRIPSGLGGGGITEDSPAHTANLRDCGKTVVVRLNPLYTSKYFGVFFYVCNSIIVLISSIFLPAVFHLAVSFL